jgi:hypothetical protein
VTTAIVAAYAAVVSTCALVWGIRTEIHGRRPDMVGSLVKSGAGPSALVFFNSGGLARTPHYLGIDAGNLFHGAVAAHLAPGTQTVVNLPFASSLTRTRMIWGWIDSHGNVDVRSNDGDRRRYSRRKVSNGAVSTEMTDLFKKLYPRVTLPAGFHVGYTLGQHGGATGDNTTQGHRTGLGDRTLPEILAFGRQRISRRLARPLPDRES